MEDSEVQEIKHCPKCGYYKGDDWTQCKGRCPLSFSPHFDPRPFYISRHVPEVTDEIKIKDHTLRSSVVCAPTMGFFMVTRNMKGQGRSLDKGSERIPKGFDVIKIEFDGSYRVFIAGLNSAQEANEAIWGYLDACLDLGS